MNQEVGEKRYENVSLRVSRSLEGRLELPPEEAGGWTGPLALVGQERRWTVRGLFCPEDFSLVLIHTPASSSL